MKNQYFGDVNDYRKYGLLRALQQVGGMRIAVCWMLTPDDTAEQRAKQDDGKFTRYLEDEGFARHDSKLFGWLQDTMGKQEVRRVAPFERAALLPGARYWSEALPDDRAGRTKWFDGFWAAAAGTDLVFFDPDNGLEVRSKPRRRKDSRKYLYWDEVAETAERGSSVLVYQHFPRVKREPYIEKRAAKLRSKCDVAEVIALRTSHVVFLLAPQPEHRERLDEAVDEVERRWAGQIVVSRHER